MSDNVNLLIEKMNNESLRRKRVNGGGSMDRPESVQMRAKEQEMSNQDKAIINLKKEHQRLSRRLDEV